jgi:hypothetical protein
MTHQALSRAGLGAVAVLLLISRGAGAGPPPKTFATPEAVVEHFLKSVAADDFDGAMAAFAVDVQIAHFDFARQVRYLGRFIATYAGAPPRYKLYVRTNTLEAMKRAANETLNFAHALLVDDTDPTGQGKDRAAGGLAAMLQAMDPAKLQDLKLVRIDSPNKSVTSTQNVLEVLHNQAAVRGADALTERIALLRLGDQHYWCGFRLLKFGSSWHIQDLHSDLAPGPSHGGLVGVKKTTPEEFEAHTK